MDLSDIRSAAADHERGKWHELVDPVTAAPTGLRVRVAGPDSDTQRRAELAMSDRLAELADSTGRVSARDRETVRLECLASCVLDWDVKEGGEPVPFNTANVLRFLRLARWIEQQVDAFAGDRAAYIEGAE